MILQASFEISYEKGMLLFQPSHLLLVNRCQWKIAGISQFIASYLKICLFCVCIKMLKQRKSYCITTVTELPPIICLDDSISLLLKVSIQI